MISVTLTVMIIAVLKGTFLKVFVSSSDPMTEKETIGAEPKEIYRN